MEQIDGESRRKAVFLGSHLMNIVTAWIDPYASGKDMKNAQLHKR